MARILTAKVVEGVKADPERRLELPDAALPGLHLVVQPGGSKSWAFRYRVAGRTRKLTVGSYPLVSLAQARERAREAAQAVERGMDPAATKAAAREAAQSGRDHVCTLLELYERRHLSKLRSGGATRSMLDRYAGAAWVGRDVNTITKRDVIDLLDSIVDRGHPVAANRTLAYLRAFFGWLRSRDILDRSPTDGVRAPVAENSRDRVLTADELVAFWHASEAVGAPWTAFLRLLLLTGQRRNEAAGMRWAEISGDVWSLPASRVKNGHAHTVPLSTAALDVLASVPRVGEFVLTANGRSSITGFAGAKLRLDQALGEAQPFTLHDLRRTAASGMAGLGIAPHVVEAILNHRTGTVRGVAAIYNRHDYAVEKRAALEAWGRHVLGLVEGLPAGNVLHIGVTAK